MTRRPRVFITRVIPAAGLAPIRAVAEADVWGDELPPPRTVLLEKVRGVDGLLSLLTDRVDDELLDAAGPRLRVVSNFAVGYDNIDVAACARRGVLVGNTPGVLTETTADLAFALLMAAARRLPEAIDYVRQDHWQTWGPMLLLGKDVHGATLGLVGFGRHRPHETWLHPGQHQPGRGRRQQRARRGAPIGAPVRSGPGRD